MNKSLISTAALALAFAAAAPAMAADASGAKSREEVRTEFIAARASGDLVDAATGIKLNRLYPAQYGTPAAKSTVTRAQVLAELAEAIRTGDIVANAESGQKMNEAYPAR